MTRLIGRWLVLGGLALGLALLVLSGVLSEPQRADAGSPAYLAGMTLWMVVLFVGVPLWLVGALVERHRRKTAALSAD